MKVCTDACLFGAVVANKLSGKIVFDILDIGTGTGLLSLMIAQKINAVIDAVEIDAKAFTQARENISNSPWKSITAFNCDINHFMSDTKYDAIISNPPFFEGDLKSSIDNKNAAKHDTSLTLQQLLTAAQKYLNDDGVFTILLPIHRIDHCIETAAKIGLFITEKILMKQTPDHPFFRGILFFGRQTVEGITTTIVIKDEAGNYSAAFTELLKDYYLNL